MIFYILNICICILEKVYEFCFLRKEILIFVEKELLLL